MTDLITPSRPLDDNQIRVVDLLKETLALAIEGKINSIGIAAAMTGGYASVMAGNKPAELMLAAFDLQCAIRESTQGGAKTQATSMRARGRVM